MQLVDDKVAVVLDEPVNRTKGGLYLANTQRSTTGIVAFVGPGKYCENVQTGNRVPMIAKVGDRVMLSEYGIDIDYDGKKYRIAHESDILAILE